MNQGECQLCDLQPIGEGNAAVPPRSITTTVRHFIRRHLGHDRSQKIHYLLEKLRGRGKTKISSEPLKYVQTEPLKTGDLVRVRSKAQIESTLDSSNKLKGCLFMYEQQPYCDTEQRVLKVMERFVDERDLRVKKCKGLVLLEGVICPGTRGWGRCDRACFMFWREEWLEKIKDSVSSLAVFWSTAQLYELLLCDHMNLLCKAAGTL